MSHAVNVEFRAGGEIDSTGISFEDYGRMHMHTRKLFAFRKLPVPAWALNNDQLRAVITRCVEARAHVGHHNILFTGTYAERLALAKQIIAARRQDHIDQCDRMLALHRLVQSKCGDTPAVREVIARKVQEADTQIITDEKIELLLLGVAYRYWRLGETSPEVGAALGIKPPLVRQLCWRMRREAGKLGYGPPVKITSKPGKMGLKKKSGKRYVNPVKETNLIPIEGRLPLVIKMHAQGYSVNQIRQGLGWATQSNNGYSMVKRLMVQAGLR